jgi:hypothetical protein
MKTSERLGDHERFKELAALAHSGALDQKERLELERHLLICSYCQEAYAGYALIANEGMDFLAAARGQSEEEFDWDDRSARDKLFTRIREAEAVSAAATNAGVGSPVGAFFLPTGISQWAAVAACLLVVVALGFYGWRIDTRINHTSAGGRARSTKIRRSDCFPEDPIIGTAESGR